MSESAVTKFICANHGSINIQDLVANGCFGNSQDVREIISNRNKFVFGFSGREQKVVAKTELRLCRARDCPGCNNLHLCKKYLLGSCPFSQTSKGCRLPHQLSSQHNVAALRYHDLEDLNRTELCTLLLQNDNYLLPPICHDYNNGFGPFGRCRDGPSCNRVHICERFMLGACSCPKAHDFNAPQPFNTLQVRGVPDQLIHSMKFLYFNKEALRTRENKGNRGSYQQPLRAFSTNDIHAAANHIEASSAEDGPNRPGQTRKSSEVYKERSFKGQNKQPYRYEVREPQWTAVPDREETENDCYDPENTDRTSPAQLSDAYTKLLEDYNTLKEERNNEKEQLDEVKRRLAAAEKALVIKQEEVDALKQKMDQKEKELDSMSFFKAQAEVYSSDFFAERAEREKIHEEKERLAAQLEFMKKKNNQLQEELDALGRQSLNEMQKRHVSRGSNPQGGAAATAARGAERRQQQGIIPEHACPLCDEILPDLDSLQIHVLDCGN